MDEQAIQTASGLEYVEIVEGKGPRPKAGDSVSVRAIPPGATLIFEVELMGIEPA